MHRKSPLFALTAALAASVSLPAHAEMMFNRIASFAVADNLPADIEKATPTSSEIITASEDGSTDTEAPSREAGPCGSADAGRT